MSKQSEIKNVAKKISRFIAVMLCFTMESNNFGAIRDDTNQSTVIASDKVQPLDPLMREWKNGNVQTLLILHVQTKRLYTIEYSPSRLDEDAPFKLAISSPADQEIGKRVFDRIKDLHFGPSAEKAPVRWAFLFLDRKGERITSLYLGRTGRSGSVDGHYVTFDSDAFFSWVEEQLGPLLR